MPAPTSSPSNRPRRGDLPRRRRLQRGCDGRIGTVTLVSSWNTLHQLRDPEFYRTLADRFWKLHFTPLGTIVILFTAAFLWRIPRRRFVDVWFASVVLFILAVPRATAGTSSISCRSCYRRRSISASARGRCSTAGSSPAWRRCGSASPYRWLCSRSARSEASTTAAPCRSCSAPTICACIPCGWDRCCSGSRRRTRC